MYLDKLTLFRTAQGNLERLISGITDNKTVATKISQAGVTLKTVDVDTVHSYHYSDTVDITENPVESGVKVNDHRIIQPRRLTLAIGVSNIVGVNDVLTSFNKSTLIAAGKLLLFNAKTNATSRAALTYKDLRDIMLTGYPFNVDTPMGKFTNMLIESIDKEQNAESISLFQGTIQLRELITYGTQTVSRISVKSGLSAINNLGQITPVNQTPAIGGSSYVF